MKRETEHGHFVKRNNLKQDNSEQQHLKNYNSEKKKSEKGSGWKVGHCGQQVGHGGQQVGLCAQHGSNPDMGVGRFSYILCCPR